jgi:hypothetical protein
VARTGPCETLSGAAVVEVEVEVEEYEGECTHLQLRGESYSLACPSPTCWVARRI